LKLPSRIEVEGKAVTGEHGVEQEYQCGFAGAEVIAFMPEAF
jgi:hypothetical protein